jgi:organic radical activating enzyme
MTTTPPNTCCIDVRSPDASKLDAPYPGREHRLYVAVTNKCNRACPFCAVHSSLAGTTFITIEQVLPHVPREGAYQVQFEGGEPFLHPGLESMAMHFSRDTRCTRVIISTNGTLFPFQFQGDRLDRASTHVAFRELFGRLPPRVLLKVSLNHHYPLLFEKARLLLDFAAKDTTAAHESIDVVFNLRRRNDPDHDYDAMLEREVDKHGLREHTNTFFLQRYGRNAGDERAELPFVVGTNWCAVNPDGTAWGIDLIGRSEGMKCLK